MNKIIGITVAVVAYNEEQNIERFLKSVFAQKYKNIKVEKILVISDGSTDRTSEIVKNFSSMQIIFHQRRRRRGKSMRLNEIYSTLTSQILVQFDADVILAHPLVIDNIVSMLISDDKIAMCGGNPIPVKAQGLVERAINITCAVYNEFRSKVRNGNNIFSADGRILAFKKEFIEKIRVPENMIANDMYTYFACLSHGYSYRYVKDAIVYFNSPKTVADHIKQNTRFRASPIRMKRYFQKELVERELIIPKKLLMLTQIKYFLRSPCLAFFIFMLNKYCEINALIGESDIKGTWDVAYTTKKLERL